MKIPNPFRAIRGRSEGGIALIMVMIAIFVLAVLAGRFALRMKVETKLASNANNESEVEWLGRSGVDYCRWILAEQKRCPEPYDALNQVWAGGPGTVCASNGPLAEVLKEFQLGHGSFTWKIVDLERKININNTAAPGGDALIQQALIQMGADPSEYPPIVGSILDWLDADNDTHVQGSETDYYESLDTPYEAKNGPIDDMSELLLVRGITQDMFWGSATSNHVAAAFQQRSSRFGSPLAPPAYAFGLVDVFTCISSGKVNINTAPLNVLQILLHGNEMWAQNIIKTRAGPDGVDGTEDDIPFNNVGEIINAGVPGPVVQQISPFCDVRSRTFECQIEAQVAGYKRQFIAVVAINNPNDIQILTFYWK